jgi:hypothetical protein
MTLEAFALQDGDNVSLRSGSILRDYMWTAGSGKNEDGRKKPAR